MNNKAFSKISIMYIAIVFLIVWAMFLAPQLAYWGHQAVINGAYSGIEALFYDNLNLVVGVIFIMALMGLSMTSGD